MPTVCGDGRMLAQIIAEQRSIPEAKAEEIVKNMRAANQYQVSFFPPFILVTAFAALTHRAGGCLVMKS